MLFLLFSLITSNFWIQDQGAFKIFHQKSFVLNRDSANVQIYSIAPINNYFDFIQGDGYYFIASDSAVLRSDTSFNWQVSDYLQFNDMYSYNNGQILAGITDNNLYISTNNGASWVIQRPNDFSDSGFISCIISPTFYVASITQRKYYIANRERIYAKAMAGWIHWQSIPYDTINGFITGLASSNGGDDSMFVATTKGVYLWSGPDSSLINISSNLPDSNILSIAVSMQTDSNIWVGTPSGLFYTNNRGNTWNNSNINDSILVITVPSENENYVFAGNNQGIYQSNNGGSIFLSINRNLAEIGPEPYIYQIKGIASVNPDTVVILTPNGPFVSYSQGDWEKKINGIQIEPSQENIDSVFVWLTEKTPPVPDTGIIDMLKNRLGNLPDVNNDGKIKVLLYDIEDLTPAGLENWCYSFFNPADEDTSNEHSNRAEIIYTDFPLLSSLGNAKKSLSASTVDMIHYYYDPDEEDWIKKVLEQYGAYVTYTGEGNFAGDYYVDRNLLYPNEATAFIFGLYLYEKYGGNDFLRDLLQSSYNGLEGLDSTLALNGYSDRRYDVLKKFLVSSKWDNPSTYGFQYANTRLYTRFINGLPYLYSYYPYYLACYQIDISNVVSSNETLYFNSDMGIETYLMLMKCGSDTVVEEIPVDSHNEAHIYIDHTDSLYIFFPIMSEGCDFKFDISPRTFEPPSNLELLHDYQNHKVELRWDTPPVSKHSKYFLYFNIFRAESASGVFNILETPDSSHFIDTSVQNESTYYYYVTALYNDGESGPTDTIVAHPTEFPPPLYMRAYKFSGDKANILWYSPDMWSRFSPQKASFAGYNLYRKGINQTSFTQIATGLTTLAYIDSNATIDTTIIYGVTAVYTSPDMESKMLIDTAAYSDTIFPPSNQLSYVPNDVGNLWTVVSNFGDFGDPNASNTGNPSYDWPFYSHSYYIWEGDLWLGTKIGNHPYVTAADYSLGYEWGPAETSWVYKGPGKGDLDIVSRYNDYGPYSYPYNQYKIGINVTQVSIGWHTDPLLKNAKVYEFYVSYDKTKSGVGGYDTLKNVYLAIKFDADVSEADPTDPHIDDLVLYDGWTGNEWLGFTHFPAPTDEYTILRDTVLSIPDGVPDQATLFGDDADEHTIYGDTELVWRNMSLMYDWDNPDEPGWDAGDSGKSPGYIFGTFIYTPPTKNDSVYIGPHNDTIRLMRPSIHAWWDWNSDPGTDENMYNFMNGTHPAMQGYRFMPHPFDLNAGVFDYRFLLSIGPFNIANGETLCFVYGTGIGIGLNGGYDSVYGMGYVPGAREIADYLMTKYYEGATHSDPLHPSSPLEDIHWGKFQGISGKREPGIIVDRILKMNAITTGNNLPVYLSISSPGVLSIKFYDVVGRCVKEMKRQVPMASRYRMDIDITKLMNGIYFVKINKGDNRLGTRKLILIR